MSKKGIISLLLGLTLATTQAGWAQDSNSRNSVSSTEQRQQADAEMEKARELLNQGYFDSAVVKYQDAFKIAPNYPAPYEELGKLMLEKKNFAYAIQMYSKLVELEPRNAEYHKVLFSLSDAYNAPNEALKSGEVLVELGQADPEMLKKMAALYKETDRPLKQAAIMEDYARATNADAEYWNEIALLYLQHAKPYEAENAADVALEKEPGSAKYRNTKARSLAAQGNVDAAGKIFEELSEGNPDDPGLKEEMAQLYVEQGDAYLSRGRANTALEYYKKAEDAGITKELDSTQPGASLYQGTVNTTDQVFDTNTSMPGVGVASYRRGATGFRSLGSTLQERKDAAELMMRPQYMFDADFGRQDVNSYQLLDNVVRIPIQGTELDLRVRHSYRDVSSFAGTASREYIYGGFNYNWTKNFSTQAYVGTNGLYDVTALYEGDRFRGGALLQRDVWNYTPVALGNDLYYNRQGLFSGVSIGDRFAIDGSIDFYQFRDGIDQTIYSIGPSYQLILDPGVQELSVSYIHAGQFNDRTIDPIVRFSPGNLQTDSIGLEYNRVLKDWWRMRAGFFQTWANDGSNGATWLVGSDFQLWKGAWLGLLYERGAFGRGTIGPNLQSTSTSNDNLNINFGVSF